MTPKYGEKTLMQMRFIQVEKQANDDRERRAQKNKQHNSYY